MYNTTRYSTSTHSSNLSPLTKHYIYTSHTSYLLLGSTYNLLQYTTHYQYHPINYLLGNTLVPIVLLSTLVLVLLIYVSTTMVYILLPTIYHTLHYICIHVMSGGRLLFMFPTHYHTLHYICIHVMSGDYY